MILKLLGGFEMEGFGLASFLPLRCPRFAARSGWFRTAGGTAKCDGLGGGSDLTALALWFRGRIGSQAE